MSSDTNGAAEGTPPVARRVTSPLAGRAGWIEVSDSYVKARFTCEECRHETVLGVGEMISSGKTGVRCSDCQGRPMKYTGLFAFV